ncbi:MAG: alkaline phosphatase family protein [Candidatus Aminicenantia bacterium]
MYVIILSIILNDRQINEVSSSLTFISLKIVYSLAFFTFIFAIISLVIDRIVSTLGFFGLNYTPLLSLSIILTICMGGYTCLTWLIWRILKKNPSGVSYRITLKENIVKIFATFSIILGATFFIIRTISPYIIRMIMPSFISFSVFIVIVIIILFNTDLSKIKSDITQNISSNNSKLFLIGLDAADWKILNPLIRKNKLPNINRIIQKGAYGYLDCYGKRLSPAIWTTIITGATVNDHGIEGFVFHQKGKTEPVLFKSLHRRKPALWNILSSFPKKVGVLNWIISYPAEEVNGYIVSMLTDKKNKGIIYPEQLHSRVSQLIGNSVDRENENKEEKWLREINNEIESLDKLTKYLLDNYDHDLFIFYTHVTDGVMHKFWQYREPEKFKRNGWSIDKLKIQQYKNAIDETWIKVDKIIGNIISKIDRNTNVVIISDHGAKPRAMPFFYVDGNELLETMGLLKFQNSSKTINFSKTKAYLSDPTIWNTKFAFSLNVKKREENGIIEEYEFEEERDRIINIFKNIRTSKGKKIFGQVQKVDNNGIDILVEQTSLLRKLNNELLIVNERKTPLKRLLKFVEGSSGNHDPGGVVIMSGPAFKRKILSALVIDNPISIGLSYLQGVSNRKIINSIFDFLKRTKFINPYTTLDIMPTMLHSLGYPVTDYMKGKIMVNVLNKKDKKLSKFSKIKEYDVSINYEYTDELPDETDERIKEQLKGLGYLG